MKTLAALLVAASLGGCVTSDYCAETHPVAYRQASPEWEANYRMCRMLQASISAREPRLAVDVYIRH